MVTPEELAQLYYYKDGKLFRTTTRSRWKAHTRVGYPEKKGYRRVRIPGGTVAESRAVWCLCKGEWPDGEIDHINRIRNDNRIENLRVVDRTGNTQNTLRKGYTKYENKSGTKFRAYISTNKKRINLGSFDTEEEASLAYKKAKEKCHNLISDN